MTEQRPRPPAPPPPRAHGRTLGALVALAVLTGALIASLAVGAQAISPVDVVAALAGHARDAAQRTVVLDLRLPRTLLGVVAGVGLGVAGALAQAVTRNPLADPGILGTTHGAAFAVAVVAGVSGGGRPAQLLAAFAGAAVATVGVYAVDASGRGGASPARLVLAGTALGAVLMGITSAMTLLDPQRFAAMTAWRAGSLAGRGTDGLALAAVAVAAGLALALAVAGPLDTIALGDDHARALGTDVARVRAVTVVAVVLLAGAATAVAGPLAFVGLTVPHIARWFAGADQRAILVLSMLLGPAVLLLADVVGRVVMPPGELPAGIVTAFVGAPLLVALVRRRPAGAL